MIEMVDMKETGIKEIVLDEIKEYAIHFEIKKIILFGSRARGDYKEKSDIDLAFLGTVTVNGRCMTAVPDELEFVPLAKYRYTAVFHADLPLAGCTKISFAQLLEYPIILMPTTPLEEFNPYKILSSFGNVTVRFADSYNLLTQFLSDGLGVSLSLESEQFTTQSGLSGIANIITRPISDNAFGSIGYLYNKTRTENNLTKQFLAEVMHQ